MCGSSGKSTRSARATASIFESFCAVRTVLRGRLVDAGRLPSSYHQLEHSGESATMHPGRSRWPEPSCTKAIFRPAILVPLSIGSMLGLAANMHDRMATDMRNGVTATMITIGGVKTLA